MKLAAAHALAGIVTDASSEEYITPSSCSTRAWCPRWPPRWPKRRCARASPAASADKALGGGLRPPSEPPPKSGLRRRSRRSNRGCQTRPSRGRAARHSRSRPSGSGRRRAARPRPAWRRDGRLPDEGSPTAKSPASRSPRVSGSATSPPRQPSAPTSACATSVMAASRGTTMSWDVGMVSGPRHGPITSTRIVWAGTGSTAAICPACFSGSVAPVGTVRPPDGQQGPHHHHRDPPRHGDPP